MNPTSPCHETLLTASAGHLSSPPSPDKSGIRGSTIPPHAPYRHPFTSQHPHPVPLSPIESFSFADSTTFQHDFFPAPEAVLSFSKLSQKQRTQSRQYGVGSDDFVPLTESGRTVPVEYEDGLHLLVMDEELPVGTPGGKKADLRRGALIDGAKHDHGGGSHRVRVRGGI